MLFGGINAIKAKLNPSSSTMPAAAAVARPNDLFRHAPKINPINPPAILELVR